MMLAALTIGARPVELVKPGEEAAYAAWLDAEVRAAAGRIAAADCSAATLQSVAGAPLQDTLPKRNPTPYSWEETVQVQGCGEADLQRLVVTRKGETWQAAPLAPGHTAMGANLQKGMLDSVAMTAGVYARRADPACVGDSFNKSLRVVNTEVVGARTEGGPWTEHWKVHACNGEYAFDISLTPTKDGGMRAHIAIPAATKPTP
jgi:hypothetical protein